MNQLGPDSDYMLSNGARVNFKVAHDASGGAVISEIHVFFPRAFEIPVGGISAKTLRELQIGELLKHWNAHRSSRSNLSGILLSQDEEEALLHALHNYPANTGRTGTPSIFLASTAYFYAKTLGENPRNPNAELAELLRVPIRTINTRVSKARSAGFLESGDRGQVGGRARGYLTPSAISEIQQFLKGVVHELETE